jgi:hypothetical protein
MKKLLYIILPAVLSVTACKKTLDQQPQGSIDASIAYTTRQGVEAGVIGAYDGIQQTGYMSLNFLIFADMYADNITWTGTFPTWSQVNNKTILPENVDIATIWNNIYSTINRANNIIAAAPNITDPAFLKDRAIGESETIRATAYFDLIRMFGGSPTGYNQAGGLGVPLRLAPTLTPENAAATPRVTEAEVYTQILADLDDAIAKLPNTIGAGRVNKYVATALKARVQLYRQQWAEAEALETTVITSPNNYALVPGASYATIYTGKNTSESLWELQYSATDANNIAFYYYPTSAGGRNEVGSSTSLRDAFEAGDLRKEVNYSTAPAGKQLKYSHSNPGTDDVMMVRLAEVYLSRAEARAMQSNLPGALEDLNIIRQRAGLSPSIAVAQDAILADIRNQRRLELAHEGHRFFDLRRYDATGNTQTFRNLFPIPQSEIINAKGIVTQNPGY